MIYDIWLNYYDLSDLTGRLIKGPHPQNYGRTIQVSALVHNQN